LVEESTERIRAQYAGKKDANKSKNDLVSDERSRAYSAEKAKKREQIYAAAEKLL
jgi:hypothetical protein